MILRKFKLSDYDEVCRWWKNSKYEVIHIDWFPKNTFVCEKDGNLLGIIFAYMMDVPMTYFDHLTISPEVKSPREIYKIVDSLIEYSIYMAKLNGKTMAMGTTKRSGLKKYYAKKGYTVGKDPVSLIMGKI